MISIRRSAALCMILFLASLACRLAPQQARSYEHEAFSFTIPSGWQTLEEVWGRPAQAGKDFYGLGVAELVMIQYPAQKGQGEVYFAVASAPLAQGEDLQTRFNRIGDAVFQSYVLMPELVQVCPPAELRSSSALAAWQQQQQQQQ